MAFLQGDVGEDVEILDASLEAQAHFVPEYWVGVAKLVWVIR